MDINTMENYELLKITNEFLSKQDTGVGVGNFCNILYGEKINPQKIMTIRKKYAAYDIQKEIPILVIDDTILGSAAMGFLLTNCAFYYRLYPVPNGWLINGLIKLFSISEIQIQCSKKQSILVVNNEKVGYLSAFSQKWPGILEANVLNELFNLYMDYLHPEKHLNEPTKKE